MSITAMLRDNSIQRAVDKAHEMEQGNVFRLRACFEPGAPRFRLDTTRFVTYDEPPRRVIGRFLMDGDTIASDYLHESYPGSGRINRDQKPDWNGGRCAWYEDEAYLQVHMEAMQTALNNGATVAFEYFIREE